MYVPAEILVTAIDAEGYGLSETGDYTVGAELEVEHTGEVVAWRLVMDGRVHDVPCPTTPVHENDLIAVPALLVGDQQRH